MSRTVASLVGAALVVAIAASPWVVRAGREGEILAAWLAAIGTVGTLGYALWQIADERTRRRRASEREQANRVSAWCTGTQHLVGEGLHVSVSCRNASDLPIYNVAVVVYPDGDWKQAALSVKRELATMGLEEAQEVDVFYAGPVMHNLGRDTPVGVTFTDAGGTHWSREPDGALRVRP